MREPRKLGFFVTRLTFAGQDASNHGPMSRHFPEVGPMVAFWTATSLLGNFYPKLPKRDVLRYWGHVVTADEESLSSFLSLAA